MENAPPLKNTVLSTGARNKGNENASSRKRGYNQGMQREVVMRLLQEHSMQLTRDYGVRSLSLFGSVARDQATSSSDVDLIVEFNRPVGYFGLFALQDHLEQLLGCRVDLGTPGSLKPRLQARVMGELIRVT